MAPSVPVIDLETAEAARRIGTACREWGFFQVVEHGIPVDVLVRAHEAMQRFFALPREKKLRVRRSAEQAWGFYDEELTKNTPDWKEVFDFGRPPRRDLPDDHPANAGVDGPNRWPESLPGFRDDVMALLDACETLGFRLLDAMGEALGVEPGRLRSFFAPTHSSFVRLNHYPSCPDPAPADAPDVPAAGHLGVNRHSDAGALTIVSQGAARGLQVRQGERWVDVDPIPGALVVNIGDMMQVWSNDRFHSPVHRVVVSAQGERYSAPFFMNPCYAADCAPLPELLERGERPHYRTINWGEFRRLRAAGDYADVGEEVQISHYRLD